MTETMRNDARDHAVNFNPRNKTPLYHHPSMSGRSLGKMRGLDESTDLLLRVGQTAGEQVRHGWDAFLNFAARDNVLEVALGLIIANSFTKVVTSFVSDIVLPVVSLLPFLNRNMDQKFAVLSQGPHYDPEKGYNTVKQARDDGALVLAWGGFVENMLNFLGVSLTLFAVAHLYMLVSRNKIIKPTASRCLNCSSWQDGREDVCKDDEVEEDEYRL
ncbi:uncharacterized protein N7503_005248 [Penicillium pulvis]|uniref:uncharacterized protein n=1 Tax=Penicillium pulvis TaxID=1562058 RepID=UPI0025488E51|nr:uncharacterized protein N7503_005248 [Penicillium pulvis]KAJ5802798.1 hypothetical protein N7503_005248 [Penicillium pulvis]